MNFLLGDFQDKQKKFCGPTPILEELLENGFEPFKPISNESEQEFDEDFCHPETKEMEKYSEPSKSY